MAGLSSRFGAAGYNVPKYALELQGRSMFDWAVSSFKNYFSSESFVFVVRPDEFSEVFVRDSVNKLGIENYKIFQLSEDTRGQAETAYLSLLDYDADFPITIFNIDTVRYKYKQPSFISSCDGYLEVFRGLGDHWSFVEPGAESTVIRTTEKERISDLCSDGLYYFKSQLRFREIFEEALSANEKVRGEFYVAPLYNRLISIGGVVKYNIIDASQIDFCGTPAEYEQLLKKKR